MIYDELCILDNCPKAAECIRNIEYHNQDKNCDTLKIINPVKIEIKEDGCEYFAILEHIKVAFGFKNLYDSLPHLNAKRLRYLTNFSSESSYFRAKKGTIPLFPEQQKRLLDLFHSLGAPENVDFDRYEDQTKWIFKKK